MKTKKKIKNPIAPHYILALALGVTLGLFSPTLHAEPESLDILTTNKAPIAPDGTTAGALTDFVITFKDLDPGTNGEELHAGATIEVVLSDEFTNTGGEPNTTILLQGWPQSPPTPPFPWTTDIVGNTITLTLTDDFKPGDFGPGAKQLHLILSGFTNPALPGVYPVELTIKPNSGENSNSQKVLSGSGHVRIIPKALPSVNPISLFSGPAGPPPPFFNPIYQTLELGEPARQLGLYLWDFESVPFIGVDVSATDNPSFYHLTQAGMEDGESQMVGEVWITAPVGANDYGFDSVPLPPGGPPSVSVAAFGTGVPVGLLGVQFTPDPEVAGDYEIAINMIGGNETTLFVTVEPSDQILKTVVLYGNIPDPITPLAVPVSGPDAFPSDENLHALAAQPFFTGELGIVSSISLPIAVNGSPTGVVHLEIWDDNSGAPGKKVASVGDIDLDNWTGADLEYQLVTFDRPVTGLKPNTKYHLFSDNSDTDVSGSSHSYYRRLTASSEGSNNAGKFQFPSNGGWRPRSHAENQLVVEILEISPSPVIITDIEVTEGAESNSVTLVWQSHPGRTYAVFASEDLQTWTQLNSDSVPSGGDQTSFNDEAISQRETSRYYRVEESTFAGPQVISSGEVFHLKINPELDSSLVPPTPPYNPPPVVHDGSALMTGAMASIRRNMDGVTVNIKIGDLNPNHAYTTWFVEIGVGGPPPFLAGDKTGDSGEGSFSGHMSAVSPMDGEFHIIIADHGPLNLLPPTYDFTSSMPPIGLDSDGVWKLNWPMVIIFEPIGSGEMFHLKINPELDPSLVPPTPPYNPPAVVHEGSALLKGKGAMASIRRNVDGVTINIKIDDLNPNHAYTTWFVEMGVGGPPPFLAGAITGDSGDALFSGDISAVSPMNGEFHIIIADHGPLNLLPPTYDFTSSMPPIGLDSDNVWKLNWPMVVIFEPISSGEVFHLKINPELDPSLVPPTPPYNPPAVVHDGGALIDGAKASIRRNVDGVTINIKIDDLNPNHAYTTWFVEIGVGGPPPFLAGDKTGDSGEGSFSGHMPGVSPLDGEFHIIIADHGPLNLLPPSYDFTSSVPPIGLDSDNVWKLNWPMVVIFEP